MLPLRQYQPYKYISTPIRKGIKTWGQTQHSEFTFQKFKTEVREEVNCTSRSITVTSHPVTRSLGELAVAHQISHVTTQITLYYKTACIPELKLQQDENIISLTT